METRTHHARSLRQGTISALILFVSLLPLLASAQLHDVRLRVLEPDGRPAANLMCALKAPGSADAAAFAFTDSTGATVLRVAATGHYGLSVLSFGKVLHEQEVDIAGAVDLGDITLRTATQQLDEVMVTAERRAVSNREGRLIFDVSSLPLKADYTAVDALVRTPLVNFSSDGVTIAGLGAEIRINGIRQQRAGGLYAYLSAIPIDRVERIEVHAGRSADLDASNSGGYVDIILRSLYGVSGFLHGGLSYYGMSYDARRRALFTGSGGAGITYGKERWSAYADVSFGAGRSTGVKSRRETTFLSSGEERTGTKTTYGDRRRGLNMSVGLNVHPSELHTFGLEASLTYMFPPTNYAEAAQQIVLGSRREQYTQTTETDRTTFAGSLLANYRYASKDGRNKLNWLANYIHDLKDEEARWDVLYTQPDTLRRHEINTDRSRSEMFYTQLAYTHRLSKEIELMAGGKYARTAMRNDNGYVEGDRLATENRFRYVEQIPAAFAEGSYSHGPLYLSAGVRMEHTGLRSHDGDIRQTYTGLYPSIRASYNFPNGLSVNLSYSRTLFRPPFQLLNHHVFKLSEREYYVGNPLLKAEVNDNIRLRLTSGPHTLYLRWGYSPNPITNMFYSSGDTLYGTNLNAARKYEYTASYSFNSRLRPWWHIAAEVELQHIHLPESQYKQRITQLYASMRHTWTIARAVSVDLNANYGSPWIMNDKWVADRFKVDLSARYTFPKSGITLSLTGQNLLARRRTESIIRNAMLHNRNWAEAAPLSILANLTWRFSAGRKKVSQERIQDNNMDRYRL